MLFKDIIGQERVKQQLRQSVQDGRTPHARLFTGAAGVGKLQLAMAYAQYLACPNRSAEDACGTCPCCLQYQQLQHPDLHFAFPIVKNDAGDTCDDFMEPFREMVLEEKYFSLDDWYKQLGVETKQGMIYEKESSEICHKLSLKAYGNSYKVMIIWQAEKMNATCANKLLKLLEEPPEKTLFLLVSEQPELLLTTILSRVQQTIVPRLSEEELSQALITQGLADAAHAADWAHIANGSYLTAKKLAQSSEDIQQRFTDFVSLMRDAYTIGQIKDANKKFESLKHIREWSLAMADSKVGRERQKAFLQYAQQQVRENYIYNLQHHEINYQTEEEKQFSAKFSPYINDKNVEALMAQLDKAEQQIGQNGNAKIIFFDLCLQFIVLLKKV